MSIARNDPCPCGSGKKYKRCCISKGNEVMRQRSRMAAKLAIVVIVLAAVLYFTVGPEIAGLVGVVGLLGIGAFLLFSDPPSASGPGSPGSINFGR